MHRHRPWRRRQAEGCAALNSPIRYSQACGHIDGLLTMRIAPGSDMPGPSRNLGYAGSWPVLALTGQEFPAPCLNCRRSRADAWLSYSEFCEKWHRTQTSAMMEAMNDESAAGASDKPKLEKLDLLSLYSTERQDSATSAVILLAQYSAGIAFISIVSGFLLSSSGGHALSPLLLAAPMIPLGLFVGIVQRLQSNEIRDLQLCNIEARLRKLAPGDTMPSLVKATWWVWHKDFKDNGLKRKEHIVYLLSMLTVVASPVILFLFTALIAWSVRSHGLWIWLVAALYGVLIVMGGIAAWPPRQKTASI